MILRYGFYEGVVPVAERERFDRHFETAVIPGLARMPGLVAVRLLRGIGVDGITPRYHHAIELSFHDRDGLVRAMMSAERRAVQQSQNAVTALYSGATPHANFELVQALPGPDAA